MQVTHQVFLISRFHSVWPAPPNSRRHRLDFAFGTSREEKTPVNKTLEMQTFPPVMSTHVLAPGWDSHRYTFWVIF